MSKNKKNVIVITIIILIIIISVFYFFASGFYYNMGLEREISRYSSYYQKLAKGCQDGCCLTSVEQMALTNSQLAPGDTLGESGCPEGTTPNMLKCPTSYRWCDPTVKVENNKFQVDINGYMRYCINEPSIFVYENGDWREANTQLPGKGMYFLDGEYHGYGMCDVTWCYKIENPIEISLVEYVEVGKKESLETALETGGHQVPDFNTKKLTGKIRVELDYYTDSDCENKKTFTTTVNN